MTDPAVTSNASENSVAPMDFGELTFGNSISVASSLDTEISDPKQRYNLDLLASISTRSAGGIEADYRSEQEIAAEISLDQRLGEELYLNRVRPVVSSYELHTAGLSFDQIVNHRKDESLSAEQHDVASVFLRYAYHRLRTWNKMRLQGHSVPQETLRAIYAECSVPTAKLVEVVSRPLSADSSFVPDVMHAKAYGLLILDKQYSPDFKDLPLEFQQERDFARFQFILTVRDSVEVLPEGFLVDLVLTEFERLAPNRTLLTRIMVAPEEFAYTWSKASLEKRGYIPYDHFIEFNGSLAPVAGIRPQEKTIKITDQVFLKVPGVQSAQELQRQEHLRQVERFVKERLAASIVFPPAYARLAIWTTGRGADEGYLFAALHDRNSVLSVQFDAINRNPERSNLHTMQGKMDGRALPAGTLDGIMNLHVLPDVAMHGPHADPATNVHAFLSEQIKQLRHGGQAIWQEHMLPDWPEFVHLRVPATDGIGDTSLAETSSLKFFNHYQSRAYQGKGIDATPVSHDAENVTYRISRAEAFKFLLLNGYRKQGDTNLEYDKPYGLINQNTFNQLARSLGCRILQSREIHTPWVRRTLLEGQCEVCTEDGSPLPLPPNKGELILQKVAPTQGVLVEALENRVLTRPNFLSHRFFKREQDGLTRELVARGSSKVYVLFPVFKIGDKVSVIAKQNYPRGILQSMIGESNTDGTARDFFFDGVNSGYVDEAIAVVPDAQQHESAADSIRRGLLERARVAQEEIPDSTSLEAHIRHRTFPSMSAIDEEQFDVCVPVSAPSLRSIVEADYSGLSTSGEIRSFELEALVDINESSPITSSQLINFAYRYLLDTTRTLPAWNGEEVQLRTQVTDTLRITTAKELYASGAERPDSASSWQEVTPTTLDIPRFYELREAVFAERNGNGTYCLDAQGVRSAVTLEFAIPAENTRLSNSTIAILPVIKTKVNGSEEILVGLELRDDLPLLQESMGVSRYPCVPAFRVPLSIAPPDMGGAEKYVRSQFAAETGYTINDMWSLGRSYAASSGITPERVHPRIVELDANSANTAKQTLHFVPIKELLAMHPDIVDAHTLSCLFRGIHALSVWKEE